MRQHILLLECLSFDVADQLGIGAFIALNAKGIVCV